MTRGGGRAIADRLVAAASTLTTALGSIAVPAPVSHVYAPLEYAWEVHERYLRRYAASTRRILFLGMNPGPWGMSQTGVPFGEVRMVREWLGLAGRIGQPRHPHPQRPVQGWACQRSEVSGRRWWGSLAASFGTSERFFAEHFVASYCPLAFLEASGRNRTPDQLPRAVRTPLEAACDQHLRQLVAALQPRWVIGIGRYAEAQAERALAGQELRIGRILHPSPASPAANRDWFAQVTAGMRQLGVWSAEPGGDGRPRTGQGA
jgi:single-strand selective monofunctional uracil DNA glycosylase